MGNKNDDNEKMGEYLATYSVYTFNEPKGIIKKALALRDSWENFYKTYCDKTNESYIFKAESLKDVEKEILSHKKFLEYGVGKKRKAITQVDRIYVLIPIEDKLTEDFHLKKLLEGLETKL